MVSATPRPTSAIIPSATSRPSPTPFIYTVKSGDTLGDLALRYNTPLYTWIKQDYGLSRVEYVVVYSLALADGAQARDICDTSGFPKNTMSRAVAVVTAR